MKMPEGYEKGAYMSARTVPTEVISISMMTIAGPIIHSYDGWWGHDTLPKLNYEDSPEVVCIILCILRQKWVSPPYNADGWRLDVAADLGLQPEYQPSCSGRTSAERVKEANPEALILAEHYGDPRTWLQGDEWDTVMNYDAFMEPVTWFLNRHGKAQ